MVDDAVSRLLAAVAAIEPTLGVRTCLIGGLARGIWAAPRATSDVDIVADVADPLWMAARAHDLGLVAVDEEVRALAPAAMTRLRLPEELSGATRLDVIVRSHDYYARVLRRRVPVEALGLRLQVASAEDIIVLKNLADRPQDRLDIAAIFEAQGERLDRDLIRAECAALELELPETMRSFEP